MTGFDIGARHVGDGAPCLIVAEVAQAHEGSLSLAHAYIDAVAKTGADAVKFQCHIAEAESTPDEPWRVEPRWPQDANRYAYWKRMEFSPEQWAGLKGHADAAGLIFLCSPFSVEAVELLNPLVQAWKVASGEITNLRLLRAIGSTGKPALLSTGLATHAELCHAEAVLWGESLVPSMRIHCVTEYPTLPEHIGLPSRYRGLSDHSGTIYAGLAAVAMGCDVLEVHVKLSEHEQGFDASSSITVEKLAELVEGVRFIEKAKRPVDREAMALMVAPMRELFLRKHERRAARA